MNPQHFRDTLDSQVKELGLCMNTLLDDDNLTSDYDMTKSDRVTIRCPAAFVEVVPKLPLFRGNLYNHSEVHPDTPREGWRGRAGTPLQKGRPREKRQ